MKIGLILSLGCFLLSCITYQNPSNHLRSTDFYLEIKQTVSGANKQYTYIITKNELHIFENSISKKGVSKKKKIYSKKNKVFEKVKEIERKAEELKKLKSEYINAQLGGLRWEIDFLQGNVSKKIIIENTSVNEVSILFESINSIIPENKPKLHKN